MSATSVGSAVEKEAPEQLYRHARDAGRRQSLLGETIINRQSRAIAPDAQLAWKAPPSRRRREGEPGEQGAGLTL